LARPAPGRRPELLGQLLRQLLGRAALALARLPVRGRGRPDGGQFATGHLWFLVCLLAFSIVLLPVFRWLRRGQGARLLVRLSGLLGRPGGVLLPAVAVAAVELTLGSEPGRGAWNSGAYALFLLAGYATAADPGVAGALQRWWRPAAALGLALFLATGAAYATAGAHADPFTAMDPLSLTFRLLKSLSGWLWVVAVLGLASALAGPTRASRWRRLAAYGNEAVLPFYVLHETVIVAVAYVVLAWPVGTAAQFGVIVLVSLAATLLLYDLGVRRSRVTRFLFGLRPAGHGPGGGAE
jgi:hypothetical protein